MRIQAIRASETLYKAGDRSFADDYKRLTKDADIDVVIQAMLTLNRWKVPGGIETIKAVSEANKARGVHARRDEHPQPQRERGRARRPRRRPDVHSGRDRRHREGRDDLQRAVHDVPRPATGSARRRQGRQRRWRRRLAGSPRVSGHRDYVVKTLLHGLTGPVDGRSYTELMIPMGANPDDWIAAVASYVRTSFGNTGGMVTPADVKRVRAEAGTRRTPWTVAELEGSLPRAIPPDMTTWKLTASHNPTAATTALNLSGWSSQAPQAPGMWFQIELPQTAQVAEIQFISTAGGGRGGGGGGGRGRGAAPGAPGAPAAPGAAGAPAGMPPGTPPATLPATGRLRSRRPRHPRTKADAAPGPAVAHRRIPGTRAPTRWRRR